jgi:PAS domain S-box-containing protein
MVFGEQEMCDLLRDTLSDHYLIIQPGDYNTIDDVDLCIADSLSLTKSNGWLAKKKTAEAPIEFPVLLILSPDELAAADHNQRRNLDGLIVTPFEPAELLALVRLLLRQRNQSIRLKTQAERIASVSKAIESTSDAISISDTTGKAIYLNLAFTSLYGYEINELNVRGIPNSLFVEPELAEEIFRTVQYGEPWRGEVALKTKQGRIVSTLLRVDSIKDSAGRRIGLIGVHTDITEDKAAEAIQHEQRAFEKAQRDIAIALTSTLDLNEVLDRILEHVGRVVSYDIAFVVLKLNETARVVRGIGIDDWQAAEWLTDQELIINEDAELGDMADGQPVIMPQVSQEWHEARPAGMRMIQSYIAVPIHLRGMLTGFLCLNSKTPDYFSPVHADRLKAFADHAAIALQNARLYEESQQLAAIQERQRLAHELHDAVSQTLYSASVIAEALPLLWERDPEKAKPQLAHLHRMTRGALAEMRTLLLELRPSMLTEANFEDLLRQLTEALEGRTHLDVTLTVDKTPSLPDDVQTALFYIAQEALNNVVKYAEATQVTVTLQHWADQLELSIIDNGRGFDSSQGESISMGSDIMYERAEAIGALLSITSQVGHGTTVVVTWTDTTERENR